MSFDNGQIQRFFFVAWINWRNEKYKIQAVLFQVLLTGEPRSTDYNSLPWSDIEYSDKWPNCQLIFINWKYLCEFKLQRQTYFSRPYVRKLYIYGLICKYWSPILSYDVCYGEEEADSTDNCRHFFFARFLPFRDNRELVQVLSTTCHLRLRFEHSASQFAQFVLTNFFKQNELRHVMRKPETPFSSWLLDNLIAKENIMNLHTKFILSSWNFTTLQL